MRDFTCGFPVRAENEKHHAQTPVPASVGMGIEFLHFGERGLRRSAAVPLCLAERLRLSGGVKSKPRSGCWVEAAPQPARRSLAEKPALVSCPTLLLTLSARQPPLTRPAPADESAVAGHPLPQGGEGHCNGEWDRTRAGRSRKGRAFPQGERQSRALTERNDERRSRAHDCSVRRILPAACNRADVLSG